MLARHVTAVKLGPATRDVSRTRQPDSSRSRPLRQSGNSSGTAAAWGPIRVRPFRLPHPFIRPDGMWRNSATGQLEVSGGLGPFIRGKCVPRRHLLKPSVTGFSETGARVRMSVLAEPNAAPALKHSDGPRIRREGPGTHLKAAPVMTPAIPVVSI